MTTPLSTPALVPVVPERADLLREWVHELPEAVYLVRRSGELLDANPAFLALVGSPSLAQARGHRLDDWCADPAARRGTVERLEREGAVRDVDLWIVRADGELRAVLDTAVLQRDPGTGEALVRGLLVDVTRHKALEDSLRDLSARDPLTGCHNRRWLADLGARLEERPGATWGCVYLDIDHFKQYNDREGHRAGDEVLTRMARFLMREVRAEESVVRVGGDEFVVVLTAADAGATEAIARRLERAAHDRAPASFSLGWAVREGSEALQATLDRADQGLLRVKVAMRVERRGEG